MKKYEDNEEDAFFDLNIVKRENGGDIVFLRDAEPMEEPIVQSTKKVKILLLVLVGIVVLSCTLAVVCFSVAKRRQVTVDSIPTDSAPTTQTWSGAFDEREIYERCCESVVTVSLGRGSSQTVWSGFVIDGNGWIATSLYSRDPSARGRLYVTLSDGSEYFVESICEDRELGVAFLKISANGLNGAELREEEVQNGERIISISAGDGYHSVVSGEVSSIQKEYLGVSLMLGERGIGAPVFDERGYLIGMASGKEFDKNGRVCYLIDSGDVKTLFESQK